MANDRQLSVVLSEFARTMLTDFPIQGILDHLVQRIVEIMPVTGAGVTLIGPSTSPRYVAASDASALRFEELQSELREGPCLLAYQTGSAVAVADLRDEARFDRFGPQALSAGLAAVFTFPLRHRDAQLGALDLYRDTPGALNDDDMAAAQTLADVTAAYLNNARARADLQESSQCDPLTGLPNQTLLLQRLDLALLRSLRSSKLVAILFVVLDGLTITGGTDSGEFPASDELLLEVTGLIATLLRPGDTLARLSGNEFIILCEELDYQREAQSIGNSIVDALTALAVGARISVSMGIAFSERGRPDHDPLQLLEEASAAIRQIKADSARSVDDASVTLE
jgi:diguanylate cyclase (GGDEF)-like protein